SARRSVGGQRSIYCGVVCDEPGQERARSRRRYCRRHRAATLRERSLMADQPQPAKLSRRRGVHLFVGFALVTILGVGIWLWWTAGRESTDDAQVDAHVTPIAARVAGTVTRLPVVDNQHVDTGAVLVELDRRDYQVAVDKARAELADAEATAQAAESNIP